MKKTIIAASLATLMSVSAQADVIGLYFGGQYFQADASGSMGYGSENSQQDFGLESSAQGNLFIAFEHPIPLIPNAKLAYATLDSSGGTTFDSDFEFPGIPGGGFPSGTTVDTGVDLSYVDYTLYYELFSNDLFAFDFGLTGRDLSGKISVSSSVAGSSDVEFDEIVPMVYANAKIGIPMTSFNVFAEANVLAYGDSGFGDAQIGLGYELLDNLAVDLDLQLGYRMVNMKLDDVVNLYSDISYEGVFAGAVVHF